MTFYELEGKITKAIFELRRNGLDMQGFGIQIELSLKSYHQLVAEKEYWKIKTEVDTPTERVHRGTVFGIPFVITQDTDRVLIAKESADK